MKILHTSDWHLGRMLHNYPLLEDQKYILTQILDTAQTVEADVLLTAGDIYDRANPSGEAVGLLGWFLEEAARRRLTCLFTAGNHDSRPLVAYGGTLMAERGIYTAPVLSGGLHPVTLEDEYGPVDFFLLPFLKPPYVRALWPEETVENYTDAVACVLRHTERTPGRRSVLAAHQFVVNGAHSPLRSDSEVCSVGGLDQVEASALEGFCYVALGHIHGPQWVVPGRVRYCGSPLKYSVSEVNQNKSLTLITLGRDGVEQTEELPLTPLHEVRSIRGPLERLTAPETVAAISREDYIHAVVTDESPVEPYNRLLAVYPRLVKLELQAVGRNQEDEPLPPLEKLRDTETMFEEFFRLQNGRDMNEEERELVRELLREKEDDV